MLDAGMKPDTAIQQALPDTTKNSKTQKEKKLPYTHQIKIAVDISRIPFNILKPSSQGYEFQADYLLRNEVYINAEAGFGRGKVNYDILKYNTNSAFVKIGVQKSLLDRLYVKDFDLAFFGLNYGTAFGQRAEATYVVKSIFGTENTGTVAPQNFFIHWGELVAGVRVEFLPRVFAGWNARGKFLFNAGTFKELSPNYIAGYGKGDKSVIFDFNMYIAYAIRWGKKSTPNLEKK